MKFPCYPCHYTYCISPPVMNGHGPWVEWIQNDLHGCQVTSQQRSCLLLNSLTIFTGSRFGDILYMYFICNKQIWFIFTYRTYTYIYIYTIERSFPHALIWSCSFPLVRQYTKRETPISSGKDILPKVGQSWIFHGSGWLSSISHDLTYNAVEGKSLPSKKKCPWNSELSVVSLVDLFFIFFLPYWFRFSRE